MAQTKVQTGVQYMRNDRYPLDGESVQATYSDLSANLEMKDKSNTKQGFFYGGLITSVVNDTNAYLNGPYYIDYTEHNGQISYHATRIPLKSESDKELYMLLDQPQYTKPDITVQFLSPITNKLTTLSNAHAIYEDVEIGTRFKPGIQFNWPTRRESVYGTRAASNEQRPDHIDNYLLGYSYGVTANGLHFTCLNAQKQAYVLDTVIEMPEVTIDNSIDKVIFDNIEVSYLHASYMFYPQLYAGGRYEIAMGTNDTAWFDNGIVSPVTQQYVVSGRYRYYWGLSDTIPVSKQELVELGNSGFLNPIEDINGTTTSFAVGDKRSKMKLWFAFPSMYAMGSYDNDVRICCHQPDGIEWDLVSPDQILKLQKLTISCGNEQMTDEYNIAYIDFDCPIGNSNAIIIFKILPNTVVSSTYDIQFEGGQDIYGEDDTISLRTESSANTIYDNTIFN